MEKLLEKLETDYYGSEGKKYLSNSDIGTLLKDPTNFKKDKEPTLPMLHGSYFHTAMLEPHLLDTFQVIECASRNSKMYKEELQESGEDMLLLEKEKISLDLLVEAMKDNFDFHSLIYAEGNTYEQASIKKIGGELWKGKADIITPGQVVDLKTTSNIDDFRYSARKYNYDSQAWVYNQLFGKAMVFLVIEKNTHRMGLFECSDNFLEQGKEKVHRALEVYRRYYGENPTSNITQFYINQTL